MPDLLRTRLTGSLAAITLAAAAAGAVATASAGGNAAREEAVQTTPAVLLSPPVVRTHTSAGLAYALFLRTSEPLNSDYDDPLPAVAVKIPSLGVSGQSERDGTVSAKSSLGGWCTRVTLVAASGHSPRKHTAPAAVTLNLTSGGGQRTSVLGVLADSKGTLVVAGRLPSVKLGCKAIGAPS